MLLVAVVTTDRGICIEGIVASALAKRIASELSTHALDECSSLRTLRVITASDVKDISFHRVVKVITSELRRMMHFESNGAVTESPPSQLVAVDVLLVTVPLPLRDSRLALFRALELCRAEEGSMAKSTVADCLFVSALVRLPPPNSVPIVISAIAPWLFGVENGTRLSGYWSKCATDCTNAVTPPKVVAELLDNTVSLSGSCEPVTCDEGHDLMWTATLSSSWFPSSRNSCRLPRTYGPGRTECLFLGVCESTEIETRPQHPQRLRLSIEARRWITSWCCSPQRVVCFVQLGSHASGERFSLNMFGTLLKSLVDEPFGFRLSACRIWSCLVGLNVGGGAAALDEGMNVVPLPFDVAALGLICSLLEVDLERSVLVCNQAVLERDLGKALAPNGGPLRVAEASDIQTMERLCREASPPDIVPATSGDDATHSVMMPFGPRQSAWVVVLGGSVSRSTLTRALSEDCSASIGDAQTRYIARKYIDEGFVKRETLRAIRYGERSVICSVDCSSSDKTKSYVVQVGSICGELSFANCECKTATGARPICRHAVALCTLMSTIPLEQVELAVPEGVGACLEKVDGESEAATNHHNDVEPQVTKTLPPFSSRYQPTPVAVTPDGLPLHMVPPVRAPQKQKRERGQSGTTPVAGDPRYLMGPNAPKARRMVSAFFYYSSLQRPILAAEEPTLRGPAVAHRLGEMWGKLSPEEKSELSRVCKEMSANLEQEWEAYRQTTEYLELLKQYQSDTEQGAHTARRRQEKPCPTVGNEDEALLNDLNADSVDRFKHNNPEWKLNAEGEWVCAWDEGTASDESEPELRPKPRPIKLGSMPFHHLADASQGPIMPNRRSGSGGLPRKGDGEMETAASMWKLQSVADDEVQ